MISLSSLMRKILFAVFQFARTAKVHEKKFIFFCFLVSFFICITYLNSFKLYPQYFTDSSVFSVIARGWLSGQIPYKDLFDHKGPFIYLLNMIALCIPGAHGLFLIEAIMICISLFFMFKSLKEFFNPVTASLTLPVFSFAFIRVIEGGNLTEEFALPGITLSLFLLCRLCKRRELPAWYLISLGIAAGSIVMLRPNMLPMPATVGLASVCMCIKDKRYTHILKNIFIPLCGFMIFCMPFVIYFIQAGAGPDFFYSTFLFNIAYSDLSFLRRLHFLLKRTSPVYFWYPVLLLSSFLYIYHKHGNEKRYCFTFWFLISAVLTYIVIAGNRSFYPHYKIISIPILSYCTAMLTDLILSPKTLKYDLCILSQKTKKYDLFLSRNALKCCGIILILLFFYPGIKQFALDSRSFVRRFCHQPEYNRTIAELIEKHNRKVLVLGNHCAFYLHYQVSPDTKYFYQYPIATFDKEVFNKTERYIAQEAGLLVLPLRGKQMPNQYFDYENVISSHYDYIGDYSGYRIFQRKTELYENSSQELKMLQIQ